MSRLPLYSVALIATACVSHAATPYPEVNDLHPSPGGRTWFVNPASGDDGASGENAASAKKTFAGVNALRLAAGDTVLVAPGRHVSSLLISGEGTAERPITVKFLPGKHLFAHGALITEKLHISNTNDRPGQPKAVGILLRGAKHVRLEGPGATILAEGKMIYAHLDHVEDVRLAGLTFDYVTPTMGELTVLANGPDSTDVSVSPANRYRIDKGRMYWTGPGWEFPLGGYIRGYNPKDSSFPSPRTNFASVEETAPGRLRLKFAKGDAGLPVGAVMQNRDITRDCCGFFQAYSKDIAWKDCTIRYMHGLGVVSQFTENIRFDNLRAEPEPGSGRTIVGWADVLHFSGCSGDIVVNGGVLGYAHDDSINVHGTHLRITGTPSPDRLALRFMHPQSYGFEAVFPGDTLDFVRFDTLRPFGSARVKEVRKIDDKNLEVVLDGPAPAGIRDRDVVENATRTASLHVSGVSIRAESTRAFLITTRKPVVIEKCLFDRTGMAAIWIEGDASSWFESGFVRDLVIRDNTFVRGSAPSIDIAPHNTRADGPVHTGIAITGNRFEMGGGVAIRSRSSETKQSGNTFLRNGAPVPEKNAVQIR